ncbi:MAG: hypothetical protein GY856_50980, partial [bacterium]|nr:hypothetical protein [bacterium]
MAEERKHKAQTGHTHKRRGRARLLAPPALLGIALLLFGRSVEADVNEWTTQGPSESRRAQERACAASVGKSVAGCGWASGFFVADLDDMVTAFAVYDDGSGAALYAGGYFITAGGVVVNHIAKWDGTAWSALSGPSGIGTDGGVSALAVYDDGSGAALYAGGYFTTAGGVVVTHIAKWDGTAWSDGPSGTGTDHTVLTFAVYDDGSGDALYIGGAFTTGGGVWMSSIAKWDGITWSTLSRPSGRGVSALAVYDDGSGAALYAGGYNIIAKWDGTVWSDLSGLSGTGPVLTFAVYDDGSGEALYAAGEFTTAGEVVVNHIAKWDGAAWSALSEPSGFGTDDYSINALAVYDDCSGAALYAGGYFTTARWDGTAWSTLSEPSGAGIGDGAGSYTVHVGALAVYDDGSGAALCAGGAFSTAGGVTVNSIAKWDGAAWSALSGTSGIPGTEGGWIISLAVYDDGSGAALYAGGYITTAGGVVVNHIAK